MVLYYASFAYAAGGPPPLAVYIQADTEADARDAMEHTSELDAYDVSEAPLERLNIDPTYSRLSSRILNSSLPTMAITYSGDTISS